MYPVAGMFTQLVLKNLENVWSLLESVGLQVSVMRWPSPPPMRSTPVVVEKLMADGAPLMVHASFAFVQAVEEYARLDEPLHASVEAILECEAMALSGERRR